jgi:hypothetical protein
MVWSWDRYVRHLVHVVTGGTPSSLGRPTGVGPFPGVVHFYQHAGQSHLGGTGIEVALALRLADLRISDHTADMPGPGSSLTL